jgi:hypothetical protein
MKTNENKADLVKAARIAESKPGESDFWKEVEDRMDVREESKNELVQPRKTTH